MPSLFPGMNPYLESPAVRSLFHTPPPALSEADQLWLETLLAPV